MEVTWSSGGDREAEGGKYRGCTLGLKLPGTLARVGSNSLSAGLQNWRGT